MEVLGSWLAIRRSWFPVLGSALDVRCWLLGVHPPSVLRQEQTPALHAADRDTVDRPLELDPQLPCHEERAPVVITGWQQLFNP